MKSKHLTMLVAALSLSVSPLATLPAAAQQDTRSGRQAQSGSQTGTDAGSQSGSSANGTGTGTGTGTGIMALPMKISNALLS
ncbi:hypothetical protein HFN65_01910 [Rhizobium laguerreae]|uniref:hypothetical protein n=1 Tax=Rhizobium laguerreae TaxID=1076926 RepID=UPI001C904C28|nr:hypothetical protein [Rhizobium laguerreae]MBY3569781.1 hypothetical protein [Rhizobium laguerreae]